MPRRPTISNEKILEAARHIFLEQGVGASTVAIAEKAGISEASIFKRFETKQALFIAAMGLSETPSWVKTLANQTPSQDIKLELIQICEQMMAFYQEVVPRIMMVMAQGNTSHPPSFPPPPVRDTQLLAQYLERATSVGYLRICNETTLAHLLVGSLMNYVIASNVPVNSSANLPFPAPKVIPPNEFVRSLIETLWNGIAPDS